jgi:2-polyprenyl-3-methyl-5-hydroxy-6-metoxy-1,4-benzoquinol methylase
LATKAFPNARVDAVDYQDTPPQLLQSQVSKVNYYNQTVFAEQHQQYDLIILRHVLEHTHHPVQMVKYLSERLTPDGVIYIEVPNLDSGCAKIFGKYWKNYYVPRHIFHYTIDSLTEVIKRAGLEAEVGRNEMPLMGNTISILIGADKSNAFVQFLGILLHPLQLVF